MSRNSSIDDLRGMPRGTAPRGPAGPVASARERELLSQALALALPDVPAEVPGGSASALLPILHHIQDALGFLPQPLVPDIAAALNLSRAEVHGVITYYHHFRSAPAGRHVVQICQAEACRANGAEALMAHASARLACAPGQRRWSTTGCTRGCPRPRSTAGPRPSRVPRHDVTHGLDPARRRGPGRRC